MYRNPGPLHVIPYKKPLASTDFEKQKSPAMVTCDHLEYNLWKLPKCMVRFCEFSHRWNPKGWILQTPWQVDLPKKKQTESCWDDDPTSTSEAICGNHFFTWGYLVETTEKVFPHLVQVYNFCGVVFRDSLITDWLVGQVLPLRIFLSFSWFISTSSWLGRYKEQFPNIRNIWNQNAFIIFPPQKKTRQHVWPKCLMQKKSTGQESFHLRPPPPSALRPNDNKISSTFPLKETPGISPISLRKLHPPPVLENPKIALPRVFCGRKIPPRWSNYQSLRWEPPPR